MPEYARSRDIVPLILNIGCTEKCLVRITSQTLFHFQSSPVPIKNEAAWAPAPGWILQRRQKKLILARIQPPDYPTHNLVTAFRLNNASYQNHY